MSNPAFGYEDLLLPHWSQTYHAATQCSRTLLLADTTEFDFTIHNALKGRGPVGNSREDIGFSLHTVLAMDPQTQAILGCMMLSPFIRQLAPIGETKAERKKRERESQVWEQSIRQIGRVPQHHQWVYVSDSNSDVYTFWQTCEDLGYDFVLRVAQDRNVEVSQEDVQAELDARASGDPGSCPSWHGCSSGEYCCPAGASPGEKHAYRSISKRYASSRLCTERVYAKWRLLPG